MRPWPWHVLTLGGERKGAGIMVIDKILEKTLETINLILDQGDKSWPTREVLVEQQK